MNFQEWQYICLPNKTWKYMKPILKDFKGDMDKLSLGVENLSITYQQKKRSNRQQISNPTTKLNITVNQVDLIDIYSILYPTTK